jgi:hypothetical protein
VVRACQVAAFPPHWLQPLASAYHRRPGIKDDWSLPTRGLVELLIGLDPAVVHVSWNLRSDRFIVALPGADAAVLAAAIASWATTEVTPDGSDVDWWELFRAEDLHFHDETINLLDYGTHPNGTATPAAAMFDLLPSFLAQHVVTAGLPLLDRPRTWIAGSPRTDGQRSAVLWPPDKLENPATGDALVTAKITFHVETVPNHPVPHIHADLSISRFPLMPVTYVPARGDGPPRATIWLHAPEGFLREREPHTLLAAPAPSTSGPERIMPASGSGSPVWQQPSASSPTYPSPPRTKCSLTPRPQPTKARSAPTSCTAGSKSLASDIDDLDDPEALATETHKALTAARSEHWIRPGRPHRGPRTTRRSPRPARHRHAGPVPPGRQAHLPESPARRRPRPGLHPRTMDTIRHYPPGRPGGRSTRNQP